MEAGGMVAFGRVRAEKILTLPVATPAASAATLHRLLADSQRASAAISSE